MPDMPKPSSGSDFTRGGMLELEARPLPNMLIGTVAASIDQIRF